MAAGVSAGLNKPFTAADGRKFGLMVGGVFLALAAFVWWRNHHPAMIPIFGGLGGILVLGGALVPSKLGGLYKAWMGLALLLSKVTTPIFMGIIYFLVITPISGLMKLFGKHSLVHKPGPLGYWHDRTADVIDPARMERQF
jgi:hypothetical protein